MTALHVQIVGVGGKLRFGGGKLGSQQSDRHGRRLIVIVGDSSPTSLRCELQKNTALSIRTYDKYLPYGILQLAWKLKWSIGPSVGIRASEALYHYIAQLQGWYVA